MFEDEEGDGEGNLAIDYWPWYSSMQKHNQLIKTNKNKNKKQTKNIF